MTLPYTLHTGDCRDVMAAMEAESIDAIVSDPPYGLNFMGREWDHGVPGVPFWAEALRVAEPGAHLVAFGGSRTFHRLVCAVEDAGWEIRDVLMWIYGCLSDDTEILVDGEWQPYHKATAGHLALCYDVAHDTYAWQPIERLYVYDYDDTAYRIESDDTDQIVSRNHRCIVRCGSGWGFEFAEEVARQPTAVVPVLEAVHGLLGALRVRGSDAGCAEQVLPRVQGASTPGAQTKEGHGRPAGNGSGRVCGVREGDESVHVASGEGVVADVLSEVQRFLTGEGMGKACAQGACALDGGEPRGACREDDGGVQPVVVRRGYEPEREGELCRGGVRPVPFGLSADVEVGRLRDGTPPRGGAGAREVPDQDGGRPSYRPRPEEQFTGEPDALREQQGSQTVRGEGHTSASLARVTPIHYVGTVWCVKVPTGAFVARRNGKVFVTGNSGFPKSLDVSKAIDKEAGAERADLGVSPNWREKKRTNGQSMNAVPNESRITIPATDAAKQWSGWGTALKPAYEPIILARKPLRGTVARNVQTFGTGAINVDGCRIAGPKPSTTRGAGGAHGSLSPIAAQGRIEDDGRGRWPSNIMLDEAAAEALDQMAPQAGASAPVRGDEASAASTGRVTGERERVPGVFHGDRGGASRFFYTSKASGEDRGRWQGNDHPTVKPTDLMRWLCRLVTPPGGLVLDPFMGSGSTGVAAVEEGFRFVGIDLEARHVEIAERRLKHAARQPGLFDGLGS